MKKCYKAGLHKMLMPYHKVQIESDADFTWGCFSSSQIFGFFWNKVFSENYYEQNS